MPAERSRAVKRTESGNNFVWTTPVAPTSTFDDAMMPSLVDVPIDMDGLPPLVDAPPPPSEFILFPPAEETPPPRRQPHSKKKPDNHIPRPPNAFILFRSSFIKAQHVSTSVETNHSTLSKIIGLTWQGLPEEERKVWHAKAKEAQDEHKRKFPQYAFRPLQTKNKGGTTEKRKVREVEPKDHKRCAKIAQLLVEGKKGRELNAEIQEFDKHHVPEIITRFEAPITARAYRRSSSAPVPETENSRATQTFLPSAVSAPIRRIRSSSSKPSRCSTPASPPQAEMHLLADTAAAAMSAQSMALKRESSLDFNSFSFDNVNSPLPSFFCDPLSDGMALQQTTDAFDQAQYNSSLSIDTDFIDTWSQCSSPVSPDPSYVTSPCSPSYGSPFDSFSVQPYNEKVYPDFNFPSYEQTNMGMGMGGETFLTTPTDDFSTFVDQHPSAQFSNIEMDFSAFMMTSLPQYA